MYTQKVCTLKKYVYTGRLLSSYPGFSFLNNLLQINGADLLASCQSVECQAHGDGTTLGSRGANRIQYTISDCIEGVG